MMPPMEAVTPVAGCCGYFGHSLRQIFMCVVRNRRKNTVRSEGVGCTICSDGGWNGANLHVT